MAASWDTSAPPGPVGTVNLGRLSVSCRRFSIPFPMIVQAQGWTLKEYPDVK